MKPKLDKLYARHRGTIIQFFKFGTVGVAGFCVDWFLVQQVGINLLGLGRIAAGLAAFPFTVTLTWLGNRLFTFRGQHSGSAHAQLMRFITVCAGGLILNRGAYSLIVMVWPLAYDYPVIGLLGGTAAGMFFNFFFARKLVFK